MKRGWQQRIPANQDELFASLQSMPQDELMQLLAVCVASTIDVVTPRATSEMMGAELANAINLDMARWWKPGAESYFQHISKNAILTAVKEFAPSHAERLAKLKKAALAAEAERLVEATGWMPKALR